MPRRRELVGPSQGLVYLEVTLLRPGRHFRCSTLWPPPKKIVHSLAVFVAALTLYRIQATSVITSTLVVVTTVLGVEVQPVAAGATLSHAVRRSWSRETLSRLEAMVVRVMVKVPKLVCARKVRHPIRVCDLTCGYAGLLIRVPENCRCLRRTYTRFETAHKRQSLGRLRGVTVFQNRHFRPSYHGVSQRKPWRCLAHQRQSLTVRPSLPSTPSPDWTACLHCGTRSS